MVPSQWAQVFKNGMLCNASVLELALPPTLTSYTSQEVSICYFHAEKEGAFITHSFPDWTSHAKTCCWLINLSIYCSMHHLTQTLCSAIVSTHPLFTLRNKSHGKQGGYRMGCCWMCSYAQFAVWPHISTANYFTSMQYVNLQAQFPRSSFTLPFTQGCPSQKTYHFLPHCSPL